MRSQRGHLRLAYTPPADAPPRARALQLLRAMIARLRIFFTNLLALAGAVLALAPLLVRRGPVGHRTQVPRPAARVIPLPPRRRASPP
ncbi:hypothetical protein [Anaeromyxobacter diazotrophicus]|nr:hypothetical protein [Anaeromyxobacter diazotrophicus]